MTTTNTLYIAPASNLADRDLATGDWTTNSFTDGDAAASAAESMDATNPLADGDEWVVCYRGPASAGGVVTGAAACHALAEDVQATQLAAVEAAHAAATGKFDGPSWDILEDLRVLGDNATDKHWERLQEDGTPSTYFAAGDPSSDRYQRHRKRLATAVEDRDAETLRELAAEEREDIEAQAAEAEAEAAEALEHARAGAWDEAVKHARQAARIERLYGDAPTWGPFEAAVKAARERIA